MCRGNTHAAPLLDRRELIKGSGKGSGSYHYAKYATCSIDIAERAVTTAAAIASNATSALVPELSAPGIIKPTDPCDGPLQSRNAHSAMVLSQKMSRGSHRECPADTARGNLRMLRRGDVKIAVPAAA